jgi:hypothetical protein
MTDKLRAAMQQALGALVRAEAMYGQPNADIQTALRSALADSAASSSEVLAEQEEKPQSDNCCKEADGCPTELAVLQRFWRQAQPQGSWVDLTDDEIDELSRTMVKGYKSVNWLSYSIITKFKEKNTPPVVTSNDGYELCEDEGCTHHGTVHYCRSITEGKI